ncbi:MAG: helix-turn-helix transcriptional regulator [Oscillospiraceae bacterium]|jgi:putative transcriptional regulator|nr:helix-turn-helix transcriptional regulator [Oscillospiraceae bacterium]
MPVSYNKLWKLLIDRKLMKKELREMAGISSATLAKMSKGKTISGEVIVKICTALHCDVGDIMEIVPDDSPE